MQDRRSYLGLWGPLVLAVAMVLLWLLVQIAAKQRKEQEHLLITVQPAKGELTEAVLLEMEKLPGFCRRWLVYTEAVQLTMEEYRFTGTLRGVELSRYPLTVASSAGKKTVGTEPLIIVGEDSFNGLTDEYGDAITQRQAEKLKKQFSSCEGTLTLSKETGAGAEKSISAVQHVQFLGTVKESGIYMDAAQMKDWLKKYGIAATAGEVMLEICGKTNADKAEKILTEAGCIVLLPGI